MRGSVSPPRRLTRLSARQDAVCTLNTLQTNASCLEQVRRERSLPQLQLQAMGGFLERAGLTVSGGGTRGRRLPGPPGVTSFPVS